MIGTCAARHERNRTPQDLLGVLERRLKFVSDRRPSVDGARLLDPLLLVGELHACTVARQF